MFNKLFLFGALIVSSGVFANTADKVAYLSYSGEYWQAYVLDTTNNTSQRVTNTDFDISVVSWLDEGKKLFVCGLQGEAGLIDIESGRFTKIQLPHKNINDAVISSDGTKVAYSVITEKANNNKLFYYDLKNNKSYALLPNLKGRQYDPKWSSDNESLYFISGQSSSHYNILKVRLESNKKDVVISNAYYNFDVDVSKTDKVAYSSNVNGKYNIWIYFDGTTRLVTNESYTNSHPSLSGDGNQLYYERVVDGKTSIWMLDVSKNDKLGQPEKMPTSSFQSRYPVVYKGK